MGSSEHAASPYPAAAEWLNKIVTVLGGNSMTGYNLLTQ